MNKAIFALLSVFISLFVAPLLCAQQSGTSLTVESVLRAVQERKLAVVMKRKVLAELGQEADVRVGGGPIQGAPAISEEDLINWPGQLPAFPGDGSIQSLKDAIAALQAAATELQTLQLEYLNCDVSSGKLVPTSAEWLLSHAYGDPWVKTAFPHFDVPFPPQITEENWRKMLKLLATRVDSMRALQWPMIAQRGFAGAWGNSYFLGGTSSMGLDMESPFVVNSSQDESEFQGSYGQTVEVHGEGYCDAFHWSVASGYAETLPGGFGPPAYYGTLISDLSFLTAVRTKCTPQASVAIANATQIGGALSLWKQGVVDPHDPIGGMGDRIGAQQPASFPFNYAVRFHQQAQGEGVLEWQWAEPFSQTFSPEAKFETLNNWIGLPDLGGVKEWVVCDEDTRGRVELEMNSSVDYYSISVEKAYRYKLPFSGNNRWGQGNHSLDMGYWPIVSGESVELKVHCIHLPKFTEFLPVAAQHAEEAMFVVGAVEMRPSSTSPVRIHLGRGLSNDYQHAWLSSRMDGFGSPVFFGAASDFELVYETDRNAYQDASFGPVGAEKGTFDYLWPFELTPAQREESGWESYQDYLQNWHLPRLRQIKGGDVIVEIDYSSSYHKTLKLYWASQAGTKSNTLYSISGMPFKTIVVKNPDGPTSGSGLPSATNRLVVVEEGTVFHEIHETIQQGAEGDEISWLIKHAQTDGGADVTESVVTAHDPDEEDAVDWSLTRTEGSLVTQTHLVCQAYFTPSNSDTPIIFSASTQTGGEQRNTTWTWDMNTEDPWNPLTWKVASIAHSGSPRWELNDTSMTFMEGLIATEQRRAFGRLLEVSHVWEGNTRTTTSKLDGSVFRTEAVTYSADLLNVSTGVGGSTWVASFDGPSGATPWMLKSLVAPGGYQESFDFVRDGGTTVVRHRAGWGEGFGAGTDTWTTTNRYGGLVARTVATSEGLLLETVTGSNHTMWGAPETLTFMSGGQSTVNYHESGHAWGAMQTATDVFGRTTSVSAYDWQGRPVSISTAFDTITPDYTNPLKSKLSFSNGDTATDTFDGFGRLIKAERTAGSDATLDLSEGNASLTVGNRQVPLALSATGEVLGSDGGLGSRGADGAWSVEGGRLCLTTALKTQSNGIHQEIRTFYDGQGRLEERQSIGAEGGTMTEQWHYSADGRSVTYTPGPGPVLKSIKTILSEDGKIVTVEEAGVEVLKKERQSEGSMVRWVTQLKDDSMGTASSWVTLNTRTVDTATRASSFTPWDLTAATVTQTPGAPGEASTVTITGGGDTLVTNLTKGRPTSVNGTIGGVPFSLDEITYQQDRFTGASGTVGGKSCELEMDVDGRLGRIAGPGFDKSFGYGGAPGYEVTVNDSAQQSSFTVSHSAVGDMTGVSGDGVQPLSASTVDLAGGATQTTWNGWLAATYGPDGSIKQKDYDGTTLDETVTYNGENLPVSHGVEGGQYQTVTYGEDSRITTCAGQSITEEYFRVGLRKKVVTPGDGREFTYLRGSLASEMHAEGPWAGAVLAYAQDDMGRRYGMAIAGVGSGFSVGYGYTAHSRLAGVTAGDGGAGYNYSTAGEWVGGSQGGLVVGVERDAIGRMADYSVSGAAGLSSHFTYDARHRIKSRSVAVGTDWYDLEYDGADRLLSATLSNGTVLSYSYDAHGNRLGGGGLAVAYTVGANNQLSGRTIGAAALGYGVSGRVAPGAQVRVFHPGAGIEGEALSVDPATGVYQGWWSSPGGGVTRVEMLVRGTLPGAGENGRDAVADKRVWAVLPLGTESYVYDGAGNLSEDGTWLYEWDGWGNLKRMTRKPDTAADPDVVSEVISYTYDSDRRRTGRSRTVSRQTGSPWVEESKVLWDGWLPVMEERRVNGSPLPRRAFVWGRDVSGSVGGAGGIGGLVSIQEEGGRVLLPVQDGLGNIVAVVDRATGGVVARYDYGPYGEPLGQSGEAEACPFRYQSKFHDTETGLSYFGYRCYSPKLGRWMSRDPLGEAGGFNLYGYCGNDPVNRWDYLGMATLEETLADGEVTMRELQELVLTATESERIIGAYTGNAPAWTPENVFADIGFEPDGFFNSYNLLTKAGRMRRDHPGKTDQEIASLVAARRNQGQAKLLLFGNLGSLTDKHRFRLLEALSDLANVSTLPLIIPSAASTPWVGPRITMQVGGRTTVLPRIGLAADDIARSTVPTIPAGLMDEAARLEAGWGSHMATLNQSGKILNMLGKRFLKPGESLIGFMQKDGTLIGEMMPLTSRFGHAEMAASHSLTGAARRGDIIPFTVGKSSTGKLNAFGSGTFPTPGGGVMPDSVKVLILKLVE